MKYIKIPESIDLPFLVKETGEPVKYDIVSFLNEWVWVSPTWRNAKDPEFQACAIRLYEKFLGATPGDIIELQDKDHEKLASVAALPNEKLQPHLAIPCMKMLFVITSATDTLPT